MAGWWTDMKLSKSDLLSFGEQNVITNHAVTENSN